jgi:hypothetical protein
MGRIVRSGLRMAAGATLGAMLGIVALATALAWPRSEGRSWPIASGEDSQVRAFEQAGAKITQACRGPCDELGPP